MASNPAAAARYTPGSWLGVVRSGTVVLLRPDSAPALVDSLWELLATGPEVHEVLDAVTSASGGSLARLPWFAIVASRGSIQVFLRGEIDLTVDLPSGPVELSGRDVTTWTERRFAAADGFSLTVPAPQPTGAGTSGAAADLPLADGVVLLQGLRVDFTGAAVPAAAPAVPAGRPLQTGCGGSHCRGPGATAEDAEAAVEDEVLAAAEADIAAELSDHGASAETVLEFPGEDPEPDGTLHGNRNRNQNRNQNRNRTRTGRTGADRQLRPPLGADGDAEHRRRRRPRGPRRRSRRRARPVVESAGASPPAHEPEPAAGPAAGGRRTPKRTPLPPGSRAGTARAAAPGAAHRADRLRPLAHRRRPADVVPASEPSRLPAPGTRAGRAAAAVGPAGRLRLQLPAAAARRGRGPRRPDDHEERSRRGRPAAARRAAPVHRTGHRTGHRTHGAGPRLPAGPRQPLHLFPVRPLRTAAARRRRPGPAARAWAGCACPPAS